MTDSRIRTDEEAEQSLIMGPHLRDEHAKTGVDENVVDPAADENLMEIGAEGDRRRVADDSLDGCGTPP